MTFGEYLVGKKINETAFRQASPDLFISWEKEFAEVHPASFTQRHLFSINKIRRQFPLPVSAATPATGPAKVIPRPKIP